MDGILTMYSVRYLQGHSWVVRVDKLLSRDLRNDGCSLVHSNTVLPFQRLPY